MFVHFEIEIAPWAWIANIFNAVAFQCDSTFHSLQIGSDYQLQKAQCRCKAVDPSLEGTLHSSTKTVQTTLTVTPHCQKSLRKIKSGKGSFIFLCFQSLRCFQLNTTKRINCKVIKGGLNLDLFSLLLRMVIS